MSKRTKRTKRRREIERLFALRDREGLSLQKLADRSGIPVGTLSWWSHRLREESSRGFTEVRLPPEETASDGVGAGRGSLRLRFPGGAVAEFEGELADRVAEALTEDLARWS